MRSLSHTDPNRFAMQPHPNVTFGGGLNETFMSPVVLVAMLVTIVLVVALPRRYVGTPLLLFLFLTPLGQEFNVGGLHFFAHRIVLLFACIRFFARSARTGQRFLAGGLSWIDRLFLVWALVRATAFVLLYRQGAAVANQLGFLWDALGAYFLFRHLIRAPEDIRRTAQVFVVIAVAMAAAMALEHYFVKNPFAMLMGGKLVPDIRNGSIRCRGVFQQEIIASTFGGTLVPLFVCLWTVWKARFAALLGLIAAVIITITASSSTGIAAAAVGVGALCLWPLRKYTRQMRWGLVVVVLALAAAMKAPVWFALAHIDFVGGSTGWDRANLIDQCIRHFSDWWLIGTADNANWGFFTWDLCNQFVAEATQGGLATLLLFIAFVALAFRKIGAAGKKARTRSQRRMLWVIGCVLCGHVAGFFGISYFDQIKDWWFVTLAMIPAATVAAQASIVQQEKPRQASAFNPDIPPLRVTPAGSPEPFALSQRLPE
jgi:hypothetical protein